MATTAFDTSELIEILKSADIPEKQAKAISMVVRHSRESANLATKEDLNKLETGVRHEVSDARKDSDAKYEALRHEISDLRKDMDAKFANVDAKFASVDAQFASVDDKLEKLSLRLTLRLGSIVAVGVSVICVALPVILKLLHVS